MSDRVAQELQRRAAQLARPPSPADTGEGVEAIDFTWDGARYLLPTSWARETIGIGGVVRVPASRSPLLGACTVRSELVPLVDLRPVCGLPAPDREVTRVVVVDDRSRPSIAIAIDVAHRIVRLFPSDLHEPPERPPAIRAVTSQGVSLLEADRLLDLPPFFSSPEGSRP